MIILELVEDEKYLNYLESIGDKNAIQSDLIVKGENIYNPDGILYITANSHQVVSTIIMYQDNKHILQSRWQEDATYILSTISIDNVSLSISTYRTDTMEKIDDNSYDC